MDVRIRLGMMEDYPSPYANIPYDVVECPEHIALSLEASKRSMVLLKNDNHFLPLKQEQVHTIAVIGPNANSRARWLEIMRGHPPDTLHRWREFRNTPERKPASYMRRAAICIRIR